jgi:hypothetical protein
MKQQVEERLTYFDSGERGPQNEDVMHEVIEQLQASSIKKKKKTKE